MNLFSDYQEKIFNTLKKLEKKKLIKISPKLKRITVELPPKNQKADLSCNAAMLLAKENNITPIELAETIKRHLLIDFKEFRNIEIAEPGFINIYFQQTFSLLFGLKMCQLLIIVHL